MSSPTVPPKSSRRSQPLNRTYVACIPCRNRKVKCVIDSEPPCAKCEREHRKCCFDVHEKSKKHREAPKWANRHSALSPPTSTSATERPPGSQQQPLPSFVSPSSCIETPSVTSDDETSATVQARYTADPEATSELARDDSSNIQTAPSTARQGLTHTVVSSTVTGPGDALDILFDAASAIYTDSAQGPSRLLSDHRLKLASVTVSMVTQLSSPQDDILDIWDKCRFVRQGWFTAQEAITYVDL